MSAGYPEKGVEVVAPQQPQQELLDLIKALREAGERRWEDPDFPPAARSLCHDWKSPRHLEKWKNLQWRRVEELDSVTKCASGRVRPTPVPEGGVRPTDIQQGILGDCYFLASLSALAGRHRALTEKLIVSSGEAVRAGVSVCRLSWNGRWVNVPISHTFPCHPWGVLAFSSAARGGLWAPLLEKAWAKLHGSYQAIEGGLPSDAFRALTGAPAKHYRLEDTRTARTDARSQVPPSGLIAVSSSFTLGKGSIKRDAAGDTPDGVWKALEEAAKQGFPSCASCGKSEDEERLDEATGLVHGHSYTLLDARSAGEKRFVLVRNPWGEGKWRGAFAEGDRRWTVELVKQLPLPGDETRKGMFWMPFSDFLQHFSGLDVCHVRQGHRSESIDVRLRPGQRTVEVTAVRLRVRESCQISLAILQRRKQKDASTTVESSEDYDSVGLEVLVLAGAEPKLVASSPFQPRREVSLVVQMQGGVDYLAVVHATPRRSWGVDVSYTVCTYSPTATHLTTYPERSVAGARKAAFERAAAKYGELLWEEDGATVRSWAAEHGYATVLVFNTGEAALLASITWTLRNLLLEPNFPRHADPEDAVTAASGDEYQREQVVELKPGERQMVLLSWVHSQQSYSMQYQWMASARPCAVCGAPVGCPVSGRFAGDYVEFDLSMIGLGSQRVHGECRSLFRHKGNSIHWIPQS